MVSHLAGAERCERENDESLEAEQYAQAGDLEADLLRAKVDKLRKECQKEQQHFRIEHVHDYAAAVELEMRRSLPCR